MTRQRVSWVAAAGLLLADLFLHKPISDICDAWVVQYGWRTYNHTVFLVIVWGSIAAALVPLSVNVRRWLQPEVIAAVLLLSLFSYGAYMLLLVANVELIHFPQYALIAGVLLLGGNRPSVAWAAAVVAGIIDETYQELVIYAGRPDTYLDVNDMILNTIGATWAVLLLTAGTRRSTDEPSRDRWNRRRGWAAAFVVALFVLLWIDPPVFSPFWRVAATARSYRVLSCAEGLVVAALLWGIAELGMGRGTR